MTEIFITLRRLYRISVTVKGPSNLPVSGASVKLQTADQMLREETSNSAGAVTFSSATVPSLEKFVTSGIRLQLAIHDRAQELRTTTVGVEFAGSGETKYLPRSSENVRYMFLTQLAIGVEVSLLAQDYTVLGFEIAVDSTYCPPKYVDVRSDSAGYIARNSLVKGCSFSLRSFDEWRELVPNDIVYTNIHAPGYKNATAQLQLGPLFEKDAYVFHVHFEPLEAENSAKSAQIAAGVLGALLGAVVIALVVIGVCKLRCGSGTGCGICEKCRKYTHFDCSCCRGGGARSLRVLEGPTTRTTPMQALNAQSARRDAPREDSDMA